MADEEDETVDMNQLLRMHTLATARSQAWARRILGEDNDPADTPDDDGGAVA